jgi:cyclase
MLAATEAYLTHADGNTKIVPGHGPLATKEQLADFHDMLLVARDRIRRLYLAGQSEKDVIAAKPMKDFDAQWAANEQAAVNFVRVVYNSFNRA